MYRQIALDRRDCNYQRILWNRSLNNAPLDYQLRTVTYGLTCAPFLALCVIKQLVADEGSSFFLAIPVLRDSLYVDDVLFGDDDESHVRQIHHQVVSLFRQGRFELRKWTSNSTDLLSDIDASDHGLACSKELGANEKIKLLGIKWNPSLDVFQIDVSPSAPASDSKRSILSTIAKLYDPLGWLTPITVAAKILMQALWREKSEWDDPVPSRLQSRWNLIYSGLEVLRSITIPRWLRLDANVFKAELHGFSDASTQAYAAVIYLRVITNSGTTRITSCFCWTDSSIVLSWLKHHPSQWKTFVANRVAEVQARLSTAEWRYVPTEDNPADCASRGLIGKELLAHSLWWQGLSWLSRSELHWPKSPSFVDDKPLPEAKDALSL
ncbi:uncharacterized protein LOC116853650 [Odontomachus brunneus]|uniref:uncharacterized protein LOC116853650 n=1 Tax=Odontomachus brunneus TaxID=486640 RepID=UPI0013F24CC0|nr:uncharacterized protein LOC116853650 [Odontomachus brunneus]